MHNRLDQFIKDNRAAFDADEPAPYVTAPWLQEKKVVRLYGKQKKFWFLTAAAAVVFFSVVGFALFQAYKPAADTQIANGVKKEIEVVKEIDPQKADVVQQFSKAIEKKEQQLVTIKNEHPVLYKRFKAGVANLDSVYHQLEEELGKHPNEEMLLEAMIQNLKLQTELLNRQLDIIHQLKQKNKVYEKTNL